MSGRESGKKMLEPPVNDFPEQQLRAERSFFLEPDDFDFARRSVGKKLGSNFDSDLEQAAYIGLLEAAEVFDEDGPAQFRSFAFWRIIGAVCDEARSRNHLDKSGYAKVKNWQRAEDRLAQELQRWPTWREVAADIQISEEEAGEILSYISSGKALSINQTMKRSEREARGELHIMSVLAETIADTSLLTEDEIIEELDKPALFAQILGRIKELVPTQSEVIIGHFVGGLAISQLARQQGVTFQAVNQKKNIALSHLTRELAEAV